MKKAFKYNYLAHHVDVVEEEVEGSSLIVSKKQVKQVFKSFKNHKRIFYCKCGKNSVLEKDYNKLSIDNIVIPNNCKHCKVRILKKDTIILNSNFFSNVTRQNLSCFNDEDKLKLVLFQEHTSVNLKTKRIFRKEFRKSIVYNKKNKRFYLYDGQKRNLKVISLSINNIKNNISSLIPEIILNKKACFNDQNKVRIIRDLKKHLVNPLNEFITLLSDIIDKRDKVRVLSHIEHVKLIDIKTVAQTKPSSWGVDAIKSCTEKYIENISILISIIQYPPLSNLLLTQGKENFIKIINNAPGVSFFRNKKPTSPQDIVSEISKGNLRYNIELQKRYIKQYKNGTNDDLLSYDDLPFYDKKHHNSSVDILTSLKDKLNKIENLKVPSILYKKSSQCNYRNPISDTSAFINLIHHTDFETKEILSLIEKYDYINFFSIIEQVYSQIYEFQNSANMSGTFDEITKDVVSHVLKLKKNNKNKNKNVSVSFYRDTIRFAKRRDYDIKTIFKIKDWDDIITLHDELYSIIQLEKIDKFKKGIEEFSKKYLKIKHSIINGIEFKLIDNIVDLEKESKKMNHCVRSYASGMSKGTHLIFSIKDLETNDMGTMEFYNDTLALEGFNKLENFNTHVKKDFWIFNQLKSRFNKKCTKKIIETILIFGEEVLKKNNIKYSINKTNYDLSIEEKRKNTPHIHLHQEIELDELNPQFLNDYDDEYEDDLPF
tara:strand:- start:11747 stop:13888 length:2142 start_codon:yes stop_codon:yes gene_type:complete